MYITEVLNIKAKLTLMREAIYRKNTIQVPNTKEDALKPIPKASQDAMDSLDKGIECISEMIMLNNNLYNQIETLEKQVTTLSVSNGVLKRDNGKLSRVNERIIKTKTI